MKLFGLSGELIGHTDAARCCCFLDQTGSRYFAATGSQDNSILLWKRNGERSDDFEVKKINHSCWITCLLGIRNGGFISGGYDGVIRLYDKEGEVLCELFGHGGGITSLSHGPHDTIVSGSWDGSFRIWSLGFLCEEERHEGMENAISAVAIGEGRYINTSTGMRDTSSGVSGYCVRIWEKGVCIRRITQHYASIRCSSVRNEKPLLDSLSYPSEVIGFATGGNDGKVVSYDCSGNTVYQSETAPDGEDKYPFILRVKSVGGEGMLSVSDDNVMRLYERSEIMQEMRHPNCVWDVDFTRQGDEMMLLSACGDGTVRLWSSNRSVWVSEERRKALDKACEMRKKEETYEKSEVNVSKLPDYSERLQWRGSKEGEVKLFRRGMKGYAFSWSVRCVCVVNEYKMTSECWMELGEVMGEEPVSLPVEVETPTGIRTLTLTYLPSENPYEAAQKFIDANQLEQDNLDEIAQYIQRSRGTRTQKIDEGNEESERSFSPDKRLVQHTKVNKAGIMKKVREFNAMLNGSMNESMSVLNDEELGDISSLLDRLCEAGANESSLDEREKGLLMRLLSWPAEYLFPVLDIAKTAVLMGDGWRVVCMNEQFDLGRLMRDINVGETPTSLLLLLYRLLTNTLCGDGSEYVMGHMREILALTKIVTILQEKPLLQAVASFLQNVSMKREGSRVNEVFEGVIAMSCDVLRAHIDEVCDVRAVIALGNALIEHPTGASIIDEGVMSVLKNEEGELGVVDRKKAVLSLLTRIRKGYE